MAWPSPRRVVEAETLLSEQSVVHQKLIPLLPQECSIEDADVLVVDQDVVD